MKPRRSAMLTGQRSGCDTRHVHPLQGVHLFALKFYLDRVISINHSWHQKTRDNTANHVHSPHTTQPITFTHLWQHSHQTTQPITFTHLWQHSQSRCLMAVLSEMSEHDWLCCVRWVNMIGCVVWGEWTWLAVLSEMSERDWLCCQRWVNVIGCVVRDEWTWLAVLIRPVCVVIVCTAVCCVVLVKPVKLNLKLTECCLSTALIPQSSLKRSCIIVSICVLL